MPQKIFQQFGTVRDNNLSDIDDLTESLNNLLDKLVDEGSTYISGDLDCIRKISTTSLDNDNFSLFAGNTESVLSPLDKLSTDFTPRKTYQNRLDIIETFTGEPRFSGGNGPSAYYFNAEQIDPKKLNGDYGEQSLFSSSKDTHEDLLNFAIEGSVETGAAENSSWTNGHFNYNGRIQDLMKGFGGVVQWEGYFIPIVTGVHLFRVNSSALYHMDWQADDYNEKLGVPGPSELTYVTAKRIGLNNTVEVEVVDQSKLKLVNLTDQKFIGEQLIASADGFINGENVRIADFDQETGIITFEGTPVSAAVGATFTLTLKKELGTPEFVHFNTPVLQKYRKYKVKWRFIMPEQDADGVPLQVQKLAKEIEFDFSTPIGGLGSLRYTRLYSHDYNFTDAVKGEMVNFIENSVLFGGGKVGRENPDLLAPGSTKGELYKNVTTNKKIDIKYQPKETLESIVRARHTINTVTGSNLIKLSDTSGIEIGTRVFGETVRFIDRESDSGALLPIEKGAEVTEIVINGGVFLSGNFQTTITDEKLIFIDHRGFVKRILGDSATDGVITLKGTAGGGGAIPGEDTTDLKDDMIVFGNDGTNGDFNKFTVITLPTNGSTDNVTVSSAKDMIYGIPIAVGNNGSVENGGTGYSNATNVATTVTPAGGTGLTVNTTTVSNVVTKVVINTAGTGYNVGDTVTITGGDGAATFKITSVSPFFYFYQSRGLINDTLIGYCTPDPSALNTVCLTAAATALATVDGDGNFNNTSIVVENDPSFSQIVGTDWVVQGSAFSSGEGSDLKAQSKIIGVDISTNTITLEDPLVKNIAKGANFTATSSGGTRILCCPPTDTSPPFLATESGLETTTADPKLVLSDGNLVFDNISATNVPMGGGVGSIDSFQNTTDSSRVPGIYTDVYTGPSGSGTGATFNITVDDDGTVTNVTINNSGQGYVVGNIITVNDSQLGGGGAANFAFTVASISGDIYEISGSPSATQSILIETGVTTGDPTDTNNQGTTFKILCA